MGTRRCHYFVWPNFWSFYFATVGLNFFICERKYLRKGFYVKEKLFSFWRSKPCICIPLHFNARFKTKPPCCVQPFLQFTTLLVYVVHLVYFSLMVLHLLVVMVDMLKLSVNFVFLFIMFIFCQQVALQCILTISYMIKRLWSFRNELFQSCWLLNHHSIHATDISQRLLVRHVQQPAWLKGSKTITCCVYAGRPVRRGSDIYHSMPLFVLYL